MPQDLQLVRQPSDTGLDSANILYVSPVTSHVRSQCPICDTNESESIQTSPVAACYLSLLDSNGGEARHVGGWLCGLCIAGELVLKHLFQCLKLLVAWEAHVHRRSALHGCKVS